MVEPSKRRPTLSAQAFKKNYVDRVNAAVEQSVTKRCPLIAKLVSHGRKAKVPSYAVWECVLAVLTGGKLHSHEKHGFDEHAEIADHQVIVDAKYSTTSPGYHERRANKVAKTAESEANPDAIPVYIPMARGHGIYLHVGFDPSENPTFQTRRGKRGGRGLASPEQVARAIDGSGRPVPFVKLSGEYRSLDELRHITESGYRRIERRLKRTIGGINMANGKEHFRKQREKEDQEALQYLINKRPEEAVRASLAAIGYSENEIAQILKDSPKKNGEGSGG
jgi:hypothetical protein